MSRALLEAINIQLKREDFFYPSIRAIIFEELSKKFESKPLSSILTNSRGGSWGDDLKADLLPAHSLRSPDIRHGSIDYSRAAVRYYTKQELEKHQLKNGDILVIKSNGSLDLVGKSQIYMPEVNDPPTTASNFILILSPNQNIIDPLYLDCFLKSPQGLMWRVDKQRTTTGLRNLDTAGYLATSVPVPPSPEVQREILNLLLEIDKNNWIENPYFDIAPIKLLRNLQDLKSEIEGSKNHFDNLLQASLRKFFP
jgi:hypothetical protein